MEERDIEILLAGAERFPYKEGWVCGLDRCPERPATCTHKEKSLDARGQQVVPDNPGRGANPVPTSPRARCGR